MAEINSVPQIDAELSLEQTRKKVIRVEGDDNRLLRLNTSDLNILVRLKEVYPKMAELTKKAAEKKLDGDAGMDEVADYIHDLDLEMRGFIDFIFDSDVSDVCVPDGTMFDMFNGQFRFEIIIEQLAKLYETNVSLEYRKMKSRVNKKAGKYTGR